MNITLKYVSSIILAIVLIGCQSDSAEEAPQQPQQSQQQQPSQQDPLGQMQESAPTVDLSDEEANTFADAAMAAQQIQMKAQQKMVGLIEDEGLDIKTYQKIAQSQQMGQGAQGAETGAADDISEADMDKFESATQAIQEAQAGIQEDVAAAIEEEGIEMGRFQEISRAAQQDPELQQQLRQVMQEKMSEEGGQGGMQQQTPTEQ